METKQRTQYLIIILISLSHCLNDLLQGVLPSIYPALQSKFALSMAQIGLITFLLSDSGFYPPASGGGLYG